MSLNKLLLRNLKKNLKNYYLYVFALVFSVTLYFAFVTLQYDPSMNEAKGTVKGAASIRAASVLLIAIVSIFLLYANTIFIKRRSKEIGLLQLIGMTKNRIFRLLTAENFILYFGSLILGIFIGFSISKLIVMILLKITAVNAIATLHFSTRALIQTVIVFCVIYLFIMLMNFLFIKKQSILALFRVLSSTEGRIKRLSIFEIIIGIFGIGLIVTGYYISSKLFSGDIVTTAGLLTAMLAILASVIAGTYLFYKGSVSFIFHSIRKRKNGFLGISEVLSLSSIMFRMKSNALLLTVITTVSALAVGLLSLSYISYYSAERTASNYVAADFAFTNAIESERFEKLLAAEKIPFSEKRIRVLMANANLKKIMETNLEGLNRDITNMPISVISEDEISGVDVKPNETIFTGYSDLLQKFMSLKSEGSIEVKGQTEVIPLQYVGIKKQNYISWYFTGGGAPVAIVDQTVFERLSHDLDPKVQLDSALYIGIHLKDESQLEKANHIFAGMKFSNERGQDSRLEISNDQKRTMGLGMFIVGFLGLTFLITSGCILYFKQMGEGEEEKPSYTILRKLGFTENDLLKGIRLKQLFNFGIPLGVGLLHGYFAVQSGWFLFGAELWTPMIIVMCLYAALYSIFGLLSVSYFKKMIRGAL